MKETKTNPSSKFMSLGAKTYVLLTQNLHFSTRNDKFYLNENVKYKFDENNISIPFNQLDVNLKNVQ